MTETSGKVRQSYKQAKRSVRKAASSLSAKIAHYLPQPVKRRLGPPYRHFQMLLLDVGLLRFVYPNRHKLGEGMWRSAQPLPHHIAKLAKQGVRTVINLRGPHKAAAYRIEREACHANGVKMIDFEVRSRAAPSVEEIQRVRQLFATIDYPALMHCKSGADRAGLMSVLYLHFKRGLSIAEARKQLSLRYGHIRHARPGVLTHFFDRYLADTKDEPMEFMTWVETRYDANELQSSFHSRGWANRLVDDILSRE